MNSKEEGETQGSGLTETLSVNIVGKELAKVERFAKMNNFYITKFFLKDGQLTMMFGNWLQGEKFVELPLASIEDFSDYMFGVETARLQSCLKTVKREIDKLGKDSEIKISIKANKIGVNISCKKFSFGLRTKLFSHTPKQKKKHVTVGEVGVVPGVLKKYMVIQNPEDLEKMGPEIIKTKKL